jgi:hypothetical protein
MKSYGNQMDFYGSYIPLKNPAPSMNRGLQRERQIFGTQQWTYFVSGGIGILRVSDGLLMCIDQKPGSPPKKEQLKKHRVIASHFQLQETLEKQVL